MRKLDIAQRIHKEAGIPPEEANVVLDRIFTLFKTFLQNGETIAINNFGTFEVRQKRLRRGRNPQTGEPLMISARRVVTFRASEHLKSEINAVQAEGPEAGLFHE